MHSVDVEDVRLLLVGSFDTPVTSIAATQRDNSDNLKSRGYKIEIHRIIAQTPVSK